MTRLLDASDGDVICLEVFDDVGVERLEGTRVAEQTKSNRTYNSLSDRAIDLWKTLDNWARAVCAGELDVDATHFEIYTAKPANGAIAASFREASTAEEAEWKRIGGNPEKLGVVLLYGTYGDGQVPRSTHIGSFDAGCWRRQHTGEPIGGTQYMWKALPAEPPAEAWWQPPSKNEAP